MGVLENTVNSQKRLIIKLIDEIFILKDKYDQVFKLGRKILPIFQLKSSKFEDS